MEAGIDATTDRGPGATDFLDTRFHDEWTRPPGGESSAHAARPPVVCFGPTRTRAFRRSPAPGES